MSAEAQLPRFGRTWFRCEPDVKTHWPTTAGVKGGGVQMPVQRKRFRIEDFKSDDATMPATSDIEVMPFHREIMTELRAIREQMGKSAGSASEERAAVSRAAENMPAMIE